MSRKEIDEIKDLMAHRESQIEWVNELIETRVIQPAAKAGKEPYGRRWAESIKSVTCYMWKVMDHMHLTEIICLMVEAFERGQIDESILHYEDDWPEESLL